MIGDYLGSGWKRQGIYIARMTKRVSETEKHVFKNGVDSPCLATSHTNNTAHVNRAHDESLKNNDNRVIWWVLDTVEEGPLVRCTTARYYHKNTRQRRCHEPCGCWEWHTNLRKKLIIIPVFMSKKAMRSRNQRLFLRWTRVSKKQCHCRIAWNVEHNEYGIDVAREGSTPIVQLHQLHLKCFMKLDYTFDSTIMTS